MSTIEIVNERHTVEIVNEATVEVVVEKITIIELGTQGPPGAGGDMNKAAYDSNDDGIVNEADVITNQGDLATLDTVDTDQINNNAITSEKIGNHEVENTNLAQMNNHTVKGRLSGNGTPQDIAMSDLPISDDVQDALDLKASASHTHTASQITDFDVEVSNNTDVSANTTARHTHANLAILNAITEFFTTALKTAYDSTVTWITTNGAGLIAHLSNTSNPHSVTKSQVGLSNVDNTSDISKPISTATQSALDNKANTSHTHSVSDIASLAEYIQDTIGTTLVAGSNVTIAYDDVANTITISSDGGGGGGLTEEQVQDLVASTLVEGANISITYDDGANTITIASTASGVDESANYTWTGEHNFENATIIGNAEAYAPEWESDHGFVTKSSIFPIVDQIVYNFDGGNASSIATDLISIDGGNA